MRIAYFVHDLHDPAVARRSAQLAQGGAQLAIAGFSRNRAPPDSIGGRPVTPLGRTQDARLASRAAAVLRNVALPGAAAAVAHGADAIVARNLEMLAIAARVRKPGQRLVYECLDIHRLLLGTSRAARGVQALEARLLARTDLVIVSSPAFRDAYFRARRGYRGPVHLIENKVMIETGAMAGAAAAAPRSMRAPWVIGWFGMLRCARSLRLLTDIARASGGAIEIKLAGRPAYAEIPGFDAAVSGVPGLGYAGPYTPDDLPELYRQVHFAWAIDYFEEGLNSSWLLPNRLYESIAHGAVPIALAAVETGAWLARAGVGIRVTDPAAEVPALLRGMTAERYAAAAAAVAAIAAETVQIVSGDIDRLIADIAGHGP